MSEKRECSEKDLEQVTGGEFSGEFESATFRCPVCGFRIHVARSATPIGAEGGICPQCRFNRDQNVKTIRVN